MNKDAYYYLEFFFSFFAFKFIVRMKILSQNYIQILKHVLHTISPNLCTHCLITTCNTATIHIVCFVTNTKNNKKHTPTQTAQGKVIRPIVRPYGHLL
jgi:hypothetical protein